MEQNYSPHIMSYKEVRRTIINYLKNNPNKDQLEISKALQLDFRLTAEVCDILLREGKLEIGVNSK